MSIGQTIFFQNYLLIVFYLLIWGIFEQRHSDDTVFSETCAPYYSKYMVFLLALPIILWAGFRPNVEDTYNYRVGFISSGAGFHAVQDTINSNVKGKGYDVFINLIKPVIGNNDVLFFVIVSAIITCGILHTWRKYSCNLPQSVFLFVVAADCYSWMFNGIRQGMAVAIVFAAYPFLFERKYIKYIIFVLLATTIHSSAIICLIALVFVNHIPWKSRTVLFVTGVLVVVAGLNSFTSVLENMLTNTEYANVVEQFGTDNGVSIQRFAVYSVPTVIAFIFRRQINAYDDRILDFAVNMSVLSSMFYFLGVFTSGIYIGRIPIYFSLWNNILLPWEIKCLFNKRNATVITIAMIAFYLYYNYYQMNIFLRYYY